MENLPTTSLERAFALFDQYQQTKSERKQLSIVKQLHALGYIIRPINTLIIGPTDFDVSKTEHLNPGSNEWGLVDMRTRRPVERPVPGQEEPEQPEKTISTDQGLAEAIAKRATMLQEKLNAANHLLQKYRDPETNEDQGNACKEGIEQLGFTLVSSEDGKPYLSVDGQIILKVRCRYSEHKDREGIHQCPKCKRWYCEECREMFLPIDPLFPGIETAKICSQCHYETYGQPRAE